MEDGAPRSAPPRTTEDGAPRSAPSRAPGEDVFLNDSWRLWWHDPSPTCTDWTDQSYKAVAGISSVRDFWKVWNAVTPDVWCSSSMYLMRDHIQPIWEDPHHLHGGCLSMKIQRAHVPNLWTTLVIHLLGETLVVPGKREHMWSVVSGASIVPKKNFSIIRVWIADSTLGNKALYQMHAPPYTEVLFKKHEDNSEYAGPPQGGKS